MLILFNWFLLLYPVAIYLDATKNNIGRVKNNKEIPFLLNMSAGAWAFASWLPGVWVVAIPAYLLYRKKLIIRAISYPVTVGKIKKYIMIIIIILVHFFSFFVYPYNSIEERNMKDKQIWDNFGVYWLIEK